jgi:hypothetical protein
MKRVSHTNSRRCATASRFAACSSFVAGAGIGSGFVEAAVVPFRLPDGGVTVLEGGSFDFDIDGDGTNDFRILDYYFGNFSLRDPISNNLIMNDSFFAAVVPAGTTIGPDTTDWRTSTDLGHFSGIRGYAGVQFEIPGGSPHFGYLDISAVSLTSVTLYGGAYETLANTPIEAGAIPEPASLALLAGGAAGLAAWRRNRCSR